MRNFNKDYSLVRGLHAVPGAGAVDIYLNGSPFFYDINFTNFTPYVYVPEGNYTVEVFEKDTKENPLVKDEIKVTKGELITLSIIGNPDDMEVLLIKEDMEMASEGKSKVRFIHLVPNGREVNLLLNQNLVASNIDYKDVTPYIEINPGLYDVEAELSENNQSIRRIRVKINPDRIYSFYALGNKPNFQVFQSLEGATFLE